jgi:hypothetical protein
LFKLSNEGAGETTKYAGVGAFSANPSGQSPSLVFYSNGEEAGSFDASKNLTVKNDLIVEWPGVIRTGGFSRAHFLMSGETNSIGLQANNMYFRGNGWSWYQGGTHNNALNNAGSGGSEVMFLSSTGHLNPSRLQLLQTPMAYNTNFPPLSVGPYDGAHMSLTGHSINSWDGLASTVGTTVPMSIAANGGDLNFGNTGSTINVNPGATFRIANHSVFIQATAPATANSFENDIWINITGAGRINIRKSGAWVAIGTV